VGHQYRSENEIGVAEKLLQGSNLNVADGSPNCPSDRTARSSPSEAGEACRKVRKDTAGFRIQDQRRRRSKKRGNQRPSRPSRITRGRLPESKAQKAKFSREMQRILVSGREIPRLKILCLHEKIHGNERSWLILKIGVADPSRKFRDT